MAGLSIKKNKNGTYSVLKFSATVFSGIQDKNMAKQILSSLKKAEAKIKR